MGCSFSLPLSSEPDADTWENLKQLHDMYEERIRISLSHVPGAQRNEAGPASAENGSPRPTPGQDINPFETSETIIAFDWDDTLCPSTWVRKKLKLGTDGRFKSLPTDQDVDELLELSLQVVSLLAKAQTLGKVVLVTNGGRVWVDAALEALMPQVGKFVSDKGIPIIFGGEQISDAEKVKFSKPARLTESKVRAFRMAIADFFPHAEQPCRNIVSIGDSQCECDALRQVAKEDASGSFITKTVKLLHGPSLRSIVVQLSALAKWLPQIVRAHHDVSIDLAVSQKW